MELSVFLKNKINEFLDNVKKEDPAIKSNIRSNEYILTYFNKDYESEIKNYIKKDDLIDAKRIYKELLDKFEEKLEKDVAIRLLTVLNKVTDIIKNNLKEYDQEKTFGNEFKRYQKVVENQNLFPKEINSKIADLHFFEGESKYSETNSKLNAPHINEQPKEIIENIEYPQRKTINKTHTSYSSDRLISIVKNKEEQINKELVNENLSRAQSLYSELKKMFEDFPSEFYDEKIEIYSDLLSLNLRIHQLAEHLDKVKKIEEQNKLLEKQEQELLLSKTEKIAIEKEKIKNEIEKIKNNIDKPKQEFLTKKPILKSDIKRIIELPKIEKPKINFDRNLEIRKEKFRPRIYKSEYTKRVLKDNSQKEVIENLYSKGLKNLFDQNNEEAKNYFEKILEINPYYKPAIIRLEQIKAKT